ncbi:MAG: SCO family protein [Cellvibrionaceae bacterium]
MRKHTIIFLLGALAVISLPLSFFISQTYSGGYGVSVSGRYLEDFQWSDINGQRHQFSDWNNYATFLFVGYLSCQVICHKRIQDMLSIDDQLTTNNVRFLFITIDPESDTTDLRHLTIDSRSRNFFSGATSENELDLLLSQLNENFHRNANDVAHNGNIYLVTHHRKIERIYSHLKLETTRIINDIPNQYFQKKSFDLPNNLFFSSL